MRYGHCFDYTINTYYYYTINTHHGDESCIQHLHILQQRIHSRFKTSGWYPSSFSWSSSELTYNTIGSYAFLLVLEQPDLDVPRRRSPRFSISAACSARVACRPDWFLTTLALFPLDEAASGSVPLSAVRRSLIFPGISASLCLYNPAPSYVNSTSAMIDSAEHRAESAHSGVPL